VTLSVRTRSAVERLVASEDVAEEGADTAHNSTVLVFVVGLDEIVSGDCVQTFVAVVRAPQKMQFDSATFD